MSLKIGQDRSEHPLRGAGSAGLSDVDTTKTLDDDGTLDEGKDAYASGIKMRDLGDNEVHQFPGLKREQWW